MSKEMICCPFCGEELDTENYYVRCRNPYCNETVEMDGTEEIWQALIQSQKDLEILINQLKDIREIAVAHDDVAIADSVNLAFDLIDRKELMIEISKLKKE